MSDCFNSFTLIGIAKMKLFETSYAGNNAYSFQPMLLGEGNKLFFQILMWFQPQSEVASSRFIFLCHNKSEGGNEKNDQGHGAQAALVARYALPERHKK